MELLISFFQKKKKKSAQHPGIVGELFYNFIVGMLIYICIYINVNIFI